MHISVIIPHYDSWRSLEICLEALANQTIDPSDFEVIVIDNDSPTWDRNVERRFLNVRFLKEGAPGSYAARNTGIEHSKGSVLAFTDSDCIPDKSWLERGCHALNETSGCGLVGGHIELFSQYEKPTAVELYEILTAFKQDIHIDKSHFSATANMFSFREVFDEVGVFDEQRFSGGDTDWGNRVFNAGYKLRYANDVVIRHPARVGLRAFYATIARKTAARYDRNPIFFKHFRIVPPLRRPFRNILLNNDIKGIVLKLKLVLLMYFEVYAPNFELIKLIVFRSNPERT